jgi:hypothetical protein
VPPPPLEVEEEFSGGLYQAQRQIEIAGNKIPAFWPDVSLLAAGARVTEG